jgi:GNAT superfamily N-acetyltransferase
LWAADPRSSRPPPARSLEVREEQPPADAVRVAMAEEGELVALRLARGCRCFGAWSGGLVAYGWLSTGPEWIGELGLEIRPAPGEAYLWNCVTLPEHRRQGLFRGLLRCLVAKVASEGFTRLWIGSVADFADRAVADAGFRPVLQFEARSFAGWGRLRVRGAVGADPADVEAALAALRVRPGARMYRVKTRSH